MCRDSFVQEIQDIHRLIAFVTAVQEGSLSSAVQKLHLTQPALSTRIKLLEESLGCVLLERHGKGVQPTPMGELIYPLAVEIIKRMQQLQDAVENQLLLREGWVHIQSESAALLPFVSPAIGRFRKNYPSVRFTLHEESGRNILHAVRGGACDIGVIFVSSVKDIEAQLRLASLKIAYEYGTQFCVIASPQHPLVKVNRSLKAGKKKLLPIHFKEQEMVLPTENTPARHLIDEEFRRLFIRPKIHMTAKSDPVILELVKQHGNLGVVHSMSVRENPSIEILEVEDLQVTQKLIVTISEDRRLTPASQSFLKELSSDKNRASHTDA